MKNVIALVLAASVISVPAHASSQVGDGLFETLEECIAASAAYDTWNSWSYVCVSTTNGYWTLEWTRDSRTQTLKKAKKAR